MNESGLEKLACTSEWCWRSRRGARASAGRGAAPGAKEISSGTPAHGKVIQPALKVSCEGDFNSRDMK